MARLQPMWLQSGSYAASQDRALIAALWPDYRVAGMTVTAATGNDVNIDGGSAAVPTANGTGSTLCHATAPEVLTLPPAPATGLDRMDAITVVPRGTDLDGGTNNDWIYGYVAGVEKAPPLAAGDYPAIPPGAGWLAWVHRIGGAASILSADITDSRPDGALDVSGMPWSAPRGYVAGYRMQPAADVTGNTPVSGPVLTVPVKANRRYRITLCWRGNNGATAGAGASIRVVGPGFPTGPWSNYQMADESAKAANEAMSGTVVTYYDATADGSPGFNVALYGAGTLKILGGSCSATAEDIGGF